MAPVLAKKKKFFPLFGGRRVEHLVKQVYVEYLCTYGSCEKAKEYPCAKFGNPKELDDPPLGVVALTEAGKDLYNNIVNFLDKDTIEAVSRYFGDRA